MGRSNHYTIAFNISIDVNVLSNSESISKDIVKNKQVAGYTNINNNVSFFSLVSVSDIKSGFCLSLDKKFVKLSIFFACL